MMCNGYVNGTSGPADQFRDFYRVFEIDKVVQKRNHGQTWIRPIR